jgi:hypothetical protein
MKKKYWLYLIFILLLIIAVVLLFSKRYGSYDGYENQFAVKDTGNISLIEIRSMDHTVTLERMQDHWMINNYYYARKKRITGLLKVISRLQVSAPVPGSIRREITSKLENEGKSLMVVINKKSPHVILMYHDTIHTNTTYMMLEHSDQPFRVMIPGYPEKNLARFFADEVNYWRDNSIFRLKEDEIMSVSMYDRLQPEQSFHLVKGKDDGFKIFTYADSTEVTGALTESIVQYLSYFSSVSFERFLTDDEKTNQADLLKNDPEYVIMVKDSRNKVTLVKTFLWYNLQQDGHTQPDLNRLIAVINETDVVLVKYVELDPVIKEIGYFLKSI